MILLAVGIGAVLFVVGVAIVVPLCDKPEGAHRRAAGPLSRAGEAPVMDPALLVHGPLEVHHEPGLTAEDAGTVAWLHGMRGLRHPGWTAFALRAQIAVLAAITSVRPDGGLRPEPSGAPGPAPATEPGVRPLDTERPWADDTGTFTAIAAGWS